MASSTKIAGTGTTGTPAGSGSIPWTSSTNITANDNNDAVNSGPGVGPDSSEVLRAKSFGFSIPSTDTIDGVVVKYERYYVTGSTVIPTESVVRLINNSSAFIGDDKADDLSFPSSRTLKTVGGSTDTWGATLTPTIINSSNFGVGIVAHWGSGIGTCDAHIDYVQITVYHTPGITGTMAATESGTDTLAATGQVFVSGTLASTESGTDTLTASGQLFYLGTMAATEESGADTAAFAGGVRVAGTLTVTEDATADTFAGTSKLYIAGTWTTTETEVDTFSSRGRLITGEADVTLTEQAKFTLTLAESEKFSATLTENPTYTLTLSDAEKFHCTLTEAKTYTVTLTELLAI